MKTIDIRGKAYVPVNERVKEFNKTYPDWSFETTIIEYGDDYVTLHVTIYDEEGRKRGDGIAHEERTTSTINKTSMWENAQTSAIGRAIGLTTSIGIDESVASADEVAGAIAKQEYLKAKIDEAAVTELNQKIIDTGANGAALLNYFGVTALNELTNEAYQKAIRMLNRKAGKA